MMRLGLIYWWPGNAGRNWRTVVWLVGTGFRFTWFWPTFRLALADWLDRAWKSE